MKALTNNLIFVLVIVLLGLQANAQIKIAAAANLQPVMKKLAANFKATHKEVQVTIITASSGKLATQITHGAPYDLFLSADMDFVQRIYNDGFATGRPAVYASGRLIVCSASKVNLSNWPQWLQQHGTGKIAIANPALAPYGKAAAEALNAKSIWQKVQPHIVYGESIAQVNTYITTGVALAGFTTASLVYNPALKQKLYWQNIDPQLYSPIKQGMVMLKSSKHQHEASLFYHYLLSSGAKKIFKQYGYQ